MEIKDIIISDVNSEGLGVGRSESFTKVLFIPNSVIGENVDAKIIKDNKNFALAEVIKVNKTSSNREVPKCIHFGNCGGCSIQHFSYQSQLDLKQKRVFDAIKKIAKIDNFEVEKITPSKKQFEYRNKMDFAFSELSWITSEEERRERRVLGIHTFGRFDRVLNIKECHLIDGKVNAIRNFIREFCISKNTSFWNPKTQKGVMRDLICKVNERGEVFIIIIFGEQPKVLQADLCMALKQKFTDIASIYWGVNKKEVNLLDDTKLYAFMGEEKITQNLLKIPFRASVKSFTQVNKEVIEEMIKKVIEVGDLKKTDIVFDLYCGIGTFSLHLAKNVAKVIGIELSLGSINDARENALENEIKNIKFIKGKVEDCLTEGLIIENGKPDVIVMDPPRNGLEKKAIDKILEVGASKLIYISCNPASFGRDASILKEKYSLTKVYPFDMFPQTTHVEIIAIFDKL